MEEEIDLKEIFFMFWNKKLIIILIVSIFAMIGVVYTKTIIKPDYEAKTTLVLVRNTSNNQDETITQTEINLNQKLVATYTELIKTDKVLRQVIANTGIDTNENSLRQRLSVKLVTTTQLIEISITDENPENTVLIADEIAKVFIEEVNQIYGINNINVVDSAKLPTKPYNINHKKDVIIFSAIGVIVAFGYVMVANMLDTTIKTSEQTEKRLGLTVLASIPKYDYKNEKKKDKHNKKAKNKANSKANKKKGEE